MMVGNWHIAKNLPEPWASSFLDSVRWTEELVTPKNQMVATGRIKDETIIPIGIFLHCEL